MMDVTSLRETLATYGQQHLLDFWDQLSDDQKQHLYQDLTSIDFEEVSRIFKESVLSPGVVFDDSFLEPLPQEVRESDVHLDPETRRKYQNEGLRQIATGSVAALLLAGGQGTRLGVKYPKGMYDVGLPSHKSLFQLQAERLLRLQTLAGELTGNECYIPWYIMISEQTKEHTEEFFEKNKYFGLRKKDIFIFEQSTLPCFTREGRIILDDKHKVARAPDGNGGLYQALKEGHVLEDMELRGVKYVHVYCVDNILVKMADPTFVGFCVSRGAEAGAKVVEKVTPTEAVGIICKVRGAFQVVEYSEITPSIAEATIPDGRLTFNAGSICNHFFSIPFLQRVCDGHRLKHHVAHKKVPFVDSSGNRIEPSEANGIKLEKFVFDVFPLTRKFVVWEVAREHEFSPLKNGPGAKKDTADTARWSLYSFHRELIEKAGGQIVTTKNTNGNVNGYSNGTNGDSNHVNGYSHADGEDEVVVEISPLVSYDGEGLEPLVSGKTFVSPVIISGKEITHSEKNGISNGFH